VKLHQFLYYVCGFPINNVDCIEGTWDPVKLFATDYGYSRLFENDSSVTKKEMMGETRAILTPPDL